MGTINYGASYHFLNAEGKREHDKDITIGIKPTSYYSDEECGYANWLKEQKKMGR